MVPSNSPQDLWLPPVPGLDNLFVSRAAQQRDCGPSVFRPDFSFDVMDPTSPVDSQGPQEEPSYPYLGGHQSSEHIGFTTYHRSSNGVKIHPFYTPANISMANQLANKVELQWMSYTWGPTLEGLNAVIVQLTANIKHLSEAKTSMEEELTHIKGENNSLALSTEANSIKDELNHHAVLKSIIQLLFFQFCGVNCDGTRKKHTVALAVVKQLGDKQLYELTDDGMQIWHPDWLGKVNAEINMKFIKELAKCAFNNDKAQREQTQLKFIPDKSFSMTIIIDCVKTYFQLIHKRAKDLNSNQGACRIKARLEKSCQQAQCVTVAAAWHKAALLYEQESGNQGTAALILTNLESDIPTCNDDKVSKDTLQQRKDAEYVTFLCSLSLCAMKQQQDVNDEPESRQVAQEPQCKQCRTTKKLHKHVFDVGPKHLSHYPPQAKAMVFKVMVDDKWYDEHLDMVVHEGINWLKGFYSHANTQDLFEVDMTYLKELDDWLKTEALGQYGSSEDEE
ncbi:hypothetical protein V8B97DRAFT_2085175 [Scleroderma yunnanense]